MPRMLLTGEPGVIGCGPLFDLIVVDLNDGGDIHWPPFLHLLHAVGEHYSIKHRLSVERLSLNSTDAAVMQHSLNMEIPCPNPINPKP